MNPTLNSPKYAAPESLDYRLHKIQQERKNRKKFVPQLEQRYFRRNEGSTDYATIPAVTLAGDFVIEFELSTIANSNSAILGSASSIDITMLSTGFVRIADGVTAITSNITVNDGAFHKVAVSREEGTVSFFVDGIPAGGGVSSASLLFEQLYRDVTTNYLAGIMANLKIYDAGTLVRDYPLNDNSDTIRDLANGQNGTIINGNADDWGLFDRQADGDWLGQELVVNGGFDLWADPTIPDGWTKSATHNANNYVERYQSSGVRLVSDGTNTGIEQLNLLTIGNSYLVSYEESAQIDPSLTVFTGGNNILPVGSGSFEIAPLNTKLEIKRSVSVGSVDCTLGSISVKEVLKNA